MVERTTGRGFLKRPAAARPLEVSVAPAALGATHTWDNGTLYLGWEGNLFIHDIKE